jgi:hypothetical protein
MGKGLSMGEGERGARGGDRKRCFHVQTHKDSKDITTKEF